MASRIDQELDESENRCIEMASAQYWTTFTMSWTKHHNPEGIEPIIAKGNRFDDVEAIY